MNQQNTNFTIKQGYKKKPSEHVIIYMLQIYFLWSASAAFFFTFKSIRGSFNSKVSLFLTLFMLHGTVYHMCRHVVRVYIMHALISHITVPQHVGYISKVYELKFSILVGAVSLSSQPWGPRFKSAGSGSSTLGQGTLCSLPSPSERT